MISSIRLPSSSSSMMIFESFDVIQSKNSKLSTSTISCSSRSNNPFIPKLEPFSNRSKIDRVIKELPLLQKSEQQLSDYCSTLEGDEAHRCWRAYFELKDLEKDLSKEDMEMLILQTGGVKSLIDCVHGISTTINQKKKNETLEKTSSSNDQEKKKESQPFPVPDGLPRTKEEIEEEEKNKMPDSSFTKLLRSKGKFPAWFSQAPDHETD